MQPLESRVLLAVTPPVLLYTFEEPDGATTVTNTGTGLAAYNGTLAGPVLPTLLARVVTPPLYLLLAPGKAKHEPKSAAAPVPAPAAAGCPGAGTAPPATPPREGRNTPRHRVGAARANAVDSA